ncbi:type I-E CRISPR-associated protein Cse2/CasB [Dickeya sp. CFBP 2040]|uniref:type I-E CRISPR-associated protein Cse2/CasB n=1 Tax=Dickeya sp. CFBP 2040 TaxID=2718531 RepID=UPI001445FA90|nr:type I-E CRISPR-associated protein Cse2/CasB [Dickeya sp. CFBP 2040]NKI76094.1 type I-E CRISPR-associated protein Cse2/CasB [Dickeya sp. CFBP 2040]
MDRGSKDSTATRLVINPPAAEKIDIWFKQLQNRHNENHNGRADRAALRRAAGPYGALTCQGFMRLSHELAGVIGDKQHRLLGVAIFAAVAAHADGNNDRKSFAAQLGEKVSAGSDRRYLSELRFERLLRAQTPEELCRLLIRAVNIRGSAGVNLPSLADGILLWMDEWQARQQNLPADPNPLKRNAVRWTCEYHQKTQQPAPDAMPSAISAPEDANGNHPTDNKEPA